MGRNTTVMVVDDEPMVVSAIEVFLQLETDYRVVGFACPRDAIEHLQRAHVDAVICDLHMARMGGQEFVMRVKALDPSMPCILLTGAVDEVGYRAACACRGGVGLLSKPWCNDELRAVLQRALARRTAPAGAAEG